VLCLINHRSFDGVVAIYDSNWYIKRLNIIKIDKKMRYFVPLSHKVRLGTLPPLIRGPQSAVPCPASPVLNP